MGRIATKTVALRKPLTHMELDALRLGDEPPEDGADDELADVGEEPVVDPMLFVPDCSTAVLVEHVHVDGPIEHAAVEHVGSPTETGLCALAAAGRELLPHAGPAPSSDGDEFKFMCGDTSVLRFTSYMLVHRIRGGRPACGVVLRGECRRWRAWPSLSWMRPC
jgi:hypothetical protein